MPGPETIGTIESTAISSSENISNAATGLSSVTAGPIEGGNAPSITSGDAAILELLQLLQEAESIITRDAGKILQVHCELIEAERLATIEEKMPLDIS